MTNTGAQGLYIVIVLCIVVLLMFRGACASPDQAERALKTQGYSDITITNHAYMFVGLRGCGTDAAKFAAKAKNPKGEPVDLYVCVGWPFKGSTIRSD